MRWKGSRPAAIDAHYKALAFNPYALDIRRGLVGLLWEDGQRDEAERQIAAMLAINPGIRFAINVNVNPETN